MRAAALLLLATGCRDVLEIEAAAPAELSYREVGTGGIISSKAISSGQEYELRFADGDGFHFPDSLMVNGVNVLGRDPGQRCDEEDESGIRISPSPRISAHGGAMPVRNELTPVLRGPATVQVKLEWSAQLACNRDRNPSGTSTFTAFPDGRIVRFDELADPSSAPLSASQCACGGGIGSSFTISTFWTLAREGLGTLRQCGSPLTVRPLPAAGEVIVNPGAQSLYGGGGPPLGFAWRTTAGTAIRGHDQVISFGFDFLRESATLPAFSYQSSSALIVGGDGCEEELVAPSMLNVNGVAIAPSERDGIYGGNRGPGGGPGIELTGDHVELTGSVSSSYAVWLRFPNPVSSLRPRLGGASNAWYTAQRVDDRSWIVWFRYPLKTDHVITIEPG